MPTKTNARMAAIFSSTMMLLVSADSRMPRTSTTVSIITMRNAGNVEAEVPARRVEHVALQVGEAAGQIRGRDPAQRGMPAEPVERRDHVRREADAHRHVADRVFQNEVPADDPGDQFAHGRVGVGVGAAGDGNHRRQLGVAQRGESADDGDQDQRKRQRRACARTAQRGRVMHDVVGERRVEDGRGVELLPGDGGADDGEDAGADDRADAQRGQRPRTERLLQPMFRLLRFGDQLVDGLAREELVRQVNAPGSVESMPQNSNRKQARQWASQRSTREDMSSRRMDDGISTRMRYCSGPSERRTVSYPDVQTLMR